MTLHKLILARSDLKDRRKCSMESPQPSKFQQKMLCQTKVAMSNLEKPSCFCPIPNSHELPCCFCSCHFPTLQLFFQPSGRGFVVFLDGSVHIKPGSQGSQGSQGAMPWPSTGPLKKSGGSMGDPPFSRWKMKSITGWWCNNHLEK